MDATIVVVLPDGSEITYRDDFSKTALDKLSDIFYPENRIAGSDFNCQSADQIMSCNVPDAVEAFSDSLSFKRMSTKRLIGILSALRSEQKVYFVLH